MSSFGPYIGITGLPPVNDKIRGILSAAENFAKKKERKNFNLKKIKFLRLKNFFFEEQNFPQ